MRDAVEWSQTKGQSQGGASLGRRRLQKSAVVVAVTLAVVPALVSAAGASTAPTPANLNLPTLSGTPTAGEDLTCSAGSWSGQPNSFSYTWMRDGIVIADEEGSSYTVQPADWGHSISCRVTAVNTGGEYTISGLPSGAYKIRFGRSFENTGNYVLEYYNGQPSSLTATPVSVTAPSITGGIDAALGPGGGIGGKVTSAATGKPLPELEVCAFLTAFAGGCATTDAVGEYSIPGLAGGLYQVVFYGKGDAINVTTQYSSGKAAEAETELVSVTAGGASRVDAAMQAGGQISGQVTSATGGFPLAHVGVCASETGEGGASECGVTNAVGEYMISGLSSGSYTVEFFPEETALFEVPENYVPEYYPEKSSEYEARPVSVTAGSDTAAVDAKMQQGGEIQGRVSAAAGGAPLADVLVCATRTTDGLEACGISGAAGEYALSGLADGSYEVQFVPGLETIFGAPARSNYLGQSYNAKGSVEEADPVSVTTPNTVTGIDAALLAGGQIAGRADDATTQAPLVNAHVCASNHEFGECTFTNGAGEYTLAGLPTGSYFVKFSAPEGANYLPGVDPGIAVIQGSTTAAVDGQLSPGGELSGRVTSASDRGGVADMVVCATEFLTAQFGGCSYTNGSGSPASASSNALAVPLPNSAFRLVSRPVFDAKRGVLVFLFKVANAGTFHWDLSFGAKKCKKDHASHRRGCVPTLIAFSSGSQTVKAGAVEVKAGTSHRALKALEAGRRLRVSGQFSFRSALGGRPVRHRFSTVLRMRKSAPKKHRGRPGGK